MFEFQNLQNALATIESKFHVIHWFLPKVKRYKACITSKTTTSTRSSQYQKFSRDVLAIARQF